MNTWFPKKQEWIAAGNRRQAMQLVRYLDTVIIRGLTRHYCEMPGGNRRYYKYLRPLSVYVEQNNTL